MNPNPKSFQIQSQSHPMGTACYRVPARKKFWVPMSTGYKPEKKFLVPMSTGYQPETFFEYRWVLSTSQKKFLGTDMYWVLAQFSMMPTAAPVGKKLTNLY